QNSGQCGHAHLDKVRQFTLEHRRQRLTNRRVIAPDGEHTPSAEQIEIPVATLVVEILPDAALVALVEADGFEQVDHLFVEMVSVKLIALRFAAGNESLDVNTHGPPQSAMLSEAIDKTPAATQMNRRNKPLP